MTNFNIVKCEIKIILYVHLYTAPHNLYVYLLPLSTSIIPSMDSSSKLPKRFVKGSFVGKFQAMASRCPEIPPVDYVSEYASKNMRI